MSFAFFKKKYIIGEIVHKSIYMVTKGIKVETDFDTMIADARQQMREGKSRPFDNSLKSDLIMKLFRKK